VIYRLGEITIEGAEAVAPEAVRVMFDSRQGDLASGEAIGKWLYEDLKKTYSEMGYIQYTAEPVPEFKAPVAGKDEGVVDFKVFVE
jgi:outer membrane protein assembly factor BamA